MFRVKKKHYLISSYLRSSWTRGKLGELVELSWFVGLIVVKFREVEEEERLENCLKCLELLRSRKIKVWNKRKEISLMRWYKFRLQQEQHTLTYKGKFEIQSNNNNKATRDTYNPWLSDMEIQKTYRKSKLLTRFTWKLRPVTEQGRDTIFCLHLAHVFYWSWNKATTKWVSKVNKAN